MRYTSASLEELIGRLIDKGLRSSDAFERNDSKAQHDFDHEAAEAGKAIVAHGDAGAAALRQLLDDRREDVQLLGAAWLVKLDPEAAAPTLYRLKRGASNFVVASNANLALMQARDNGLLPALD